MPTIEDIKALIQELDEVVLDSCVNVNITINIDWPAAQAQPPAEEPLGPRILGATVTAEKTLARFATSTNLKGRPVMAIYPSDTSAPAERIRYNRGARFSVYAEVVTADGGAQYHRIDDPGLPVVLYVSRADVDLEE